MNSKEKPQVSKSSLSASAQASLNQHLHKYIFLINFPCNLLLEHDFAIMRNAWIHTSLAIIELKLSAKL